MQEFIISLIVFFQLIFSTMVKIVFCAFLTSIIFFIVKLYARRGVRDTKEKNWTSAKNAFMIAFCALFMLAFFEVIGFFEWLFELLLGGYI